MKKSRILSHIGSFQRSRLWHAWCTQQAYCRLVWSDSRSQDQRRPLSDEICHLQGHKWTNNHDQQAFVRRNGVETVGDVLLCLLITAFHKIDISCGSGININRGPWYDWGTRRKSRCTGQWRPRSLILCHQIIRHSRPWSITVYR